MAGGNSGLMELVTAIDVAKEFGAKAGCMHSQRKAHRLWKELEPSLTGDERVAIRIAWNHHLIGEGRKELDSMMTVVVRRLELTREARLKRTGAK